MIRRHLLLFLFLAAGCVDLPDVPDTDPSYMRPGSGTAAITPPFQPKTDEIPEKDFDTTGLQIETISEGTGKTAAIGDYVSVHYTGTLTNGTKFDSSWDRGEPFTFRLGAGNVIKGWEAGVKGMKVGEKRKLIIPPQLGYGAAGSPPKIPSNATLIFEIDLLDVK